MAKQVKKLTDTRIRSAKSESKQYRLSDGDGLYMLVKPSGSKLWRFDYVRPSGGRNTLSFGKYPEVSLQHAREKRLEARTQVAKEVDPAVVRRASHAETFELIALEWWKKQKSSWSSCHAETTLARMKNKLFPWIGNRPIAEVTAPELLSVLHRIEKGGAVETAHRCKTISGQVFRYAIATGRAERDISSDLKGALQPVTATPHAAIIDPVRLAKLLNDIDHYSGSFVVRCASQLAPLVFQRPGELRFSQWSEFDLDAATWLIPIERMKLKKAQKIRRAGEKHLVPLSRQAVSILRELKPLTGHRDYVFPAIRGNRPMSDNTLNAALRTMGYTKDVMTAHGWRATARTMLAEVLNFPPPAIEKQLFHAVADPLGESYNRAQHIEERIKMMQAWADYLDKLKGASHEG